MPTAHLNGIDVYHERWGDGPPLLFCNGSGATLDGMRLLLDGIAQRFDLLVPDQRGIGRTEIPPGPYSMADYAADALALLDHAGWSSARVVGVSFGGMVAQELAVTAPDRVERLALLCTSPGGGLASYPLHELDGLDPAKRRETYLPLLDTRFSEEWLADPDHGTDRFLADLLAQTPEKSDEVRRGEREQLGARRHHDVLDRLGRITCPTLVAAGRYDGIAPPANAEAIAAAVPDADLRLYEGGHAFFVQDPRALPEILDFLAA